VTLRRCVNRSRFFEGKSCLLLLQGRRGDLSDLANLKSSFFEKKNSVFNDIEVNISQGSVISSLIIGVANFIFQQLLEGIRYTNLKETHLEKC
jgi:hypothetical protein